MKDFISALGDRLEDMAREDERRRRPWWSRLLRRFGGGRS